DFLVAARAEQPDITLEALSRRPAAERSVKADTSMLSRFFRREGITFKNVWPAPGLQAVSRRWVEAVCLNDGMDGPAFSGRRMIARSPVGHQPGGRTR